MMESRPDGTRAVHRVLNLIMELGQHLSGASAATLASRLDLPSPTVHRLLQVLVATGFATKDPVTKHYSLGPRVVSLAHRVNGGVVLHAIARDELKQLAETTAETVFLSVLDGNDILFLDCIPSSHAVQLWSPPGTRRPLHATSQGKAVLSFQPAQIVERLLASCDFRAHTARTIIDRENLYRELSQVRRDGFAISDGEFQQDVRSVAAPILDSRQQAVGAVCVGMPSFRVTLQRLRDELAPLVVETANKISAQIQAQVERAGLAAAPGDGRPAVEIAPLVRTSG